MLVGTSVLKVNDETMRKMLAEHLNDCLLKTDVPEQEVTQIKPITNEGVVTAFEIHLEAFVPEKD